MFFTIVNKRVLKTIVASLVVSLREGIEIALIVAVILSYLRKSDLQSLGRYVAVGAILATFTSIGVALVMAALWGAFEGPGFAVFEGVVVLVAALLLTSMILWMWKSGGKITSEIEASAGRQAGLRGGIGLLLLSFALILREGVELVLFSMALAVEDMFQTYVGVSAGLLLAMMVGFGIYRGSFHMSLRSFFKWTSTLLILFAAGMVAYGIHELQEAGLLLVGPLEVWNINPPLLPDGSYPLLHEDGLIGGLAKALFGYDGNPSALELVGYAFYILVVSSYYLMNRPSKDSGRIPSEARLQQPVISQQVPPQMSPYVHQPKWLLALFSAIYQRGNKHTSFTHRIEGTRK